MSPVARSLRRPLGSEALPSPFVPLAAFALALLALASPAAAQSAVCATVKLEIPQKLTLERDAFDAELILRNTSGAALEAILVTLEFESVEGDDATAQFFVTVPTIAGVGSIDGNGNILPGDTARVNWLLIPAQGAGGADPGGLGYRARAHIEYVFGGNQLSVTSTWADFTVFPQPYLDLVYALPRHVRSDDPFTPQTEPPVPFDLGVHIHNKGGGAARQLAIVSAQPRIVQNDLGLLIDFETTGSEIAGVPGPGSLSISFGDLAPGACTSGAWIMRTTLSGWFVEMSAGYTHSEALGGEDTSLLDQITTRWMVGRVRVDGPGGDQLDDFVVEAADAPPTEESMAPPDAYFLLNSNCQEDLVTRVDGAVEGVPTLANPSVRVTATLQPGFNVVVAPDPLGDGTPVLRARREEDLSALHPRNAWSGRERDETDRLFLFEFTDVAGPRAWTVTYDIALADVLPPVSTLTVVSGPSRLLVAVPPVWVGTPYTVYSADATDSLSGVARIEFAQDGGPWTLLSPFYFTAPGSHTAALRATDAAGNVEDPVERTVLVDTAPPAVSVLSPLAGTNHWAGDGIPVDFTVDDEVPSEIQVTARLEAVEAGEPGLDVQSGDVVAGTLLVPGDYVLHITATDWLDQRTEHVEGPFTLLPDPPSLQLTGVADGAVVRGPVAFEAEAAGYGIGAPTLTIDDAPHALGAPYAVEGAHLAEAVVRDAFDQEASVRVSFTIDDTPPLVTLNGVEDSATLPPGVFATWTVEDMTAVQVVATLDGAPYDEGTPIQALGPHTLTLLAEDAAGNRTELAVTFEVAHEPPVVALRVEDEGGAPVADVRVLLVYDDEDRSFAGALAVTDAQGACTLQAPEPGDFLVRVDAGLRRDFLGPFALDWGFRSETVVRPDATAYTETRHVDAGAPVEGADGTVERPFPSLAAALVGAPFGALIQIAHGTYALDEPLSVPEGVRITGGLASGTFMADPLGPGTVVAGPAGGPALRFEGTVHAVAGDLRVEGPVEGIAGAPLLHDLAVFASGTGGAGGAGPALRFVDAADPLLAVELHDVLAQGAGGAVVALEGDATVDAVLVTLVDGDGAGVSLAPGAALRLSHAIVADVGGAAFDIGDGATVDLERTLVSGAEGGVSTGAGALNADGDDLFGVDPLFVVGPRHGYYLSQPAGGQDATSPAVDAGRYDGADYELTEHTTAVTGAPDQGRVDLGYHAWPVPAPPGPEVEAGAEVVEAVDVVEPAADVVEPTPDVVEGEVVGPTDVVTPPEDVPAPPEDVPAPPEDVPAPPEDVPAPPEDVPAPPEDVPAPPEDVVTPPEDVVTPPEDVPAPPEDVPAPPEDVPAPPEDVPAPPEDVPAPPEDVPAPPEDVPAPPEDVPTPPDDVVTPPEDVGHPKPDAGSVHPDGGGVSYDVIRDSAATPDSSGGGADGGGSGGGGGGCAAAGPSSSGALPALAVVLLLGLVLLRRRPARGGRAALLGVALVAGFAGPAAAQVDPLAGPQPTVYYGRAFGGSDQLRLMGLQDGTDVVVTNTDNGATLWSGTLASWGRRDVAVGNRHYKVLTGAPVFAYMGYDCCSYGGSFFYPSTSFSRRTGREFEFFVPVQSGANTFTVFAYEDTDVTMTRPDGTAFATRTMTAYTAWTPGVTTGQAYRLTSTGLVALQSNASNGYDAAPARNGADVGTEFLFGTKSWGGGGYAVFAYDDAHVVIHKLDGTLAYEGDVAAGTYLHRSGQGANHWHLESTGRVGVWAGDFEGGTSVAYLGDDLSFHQGVDGVEFWFHTQVVGSTVFTSRDGTELTWTDVATGTPTVVLRDADGYLDLPAGKFVHLVSNQPVIVESFGGTSLNDYGNLLRPVPPGGLAGFRVTPSATTRVAGEAFTVAVVAVDDIGGINPGYEGVVALQSADPLAALPDPYAFTAADEGSHVFADVVLSTAGTWAVTARDAGPDPDLLGTATVVVQPAAPSAGASALAFTPPAPLADGATGVVVALAVRDPFGNAVPGLAVTFTSDLGTLVGAVVERVPGTYEQTLRAPLAPGTAAIDGQIDGVSFLAGTLPFVEDTIAPPPVTVTVTAIGHATFDLSWTASAAVDVATYRVAWRPAGGVWGDPVEVDAPTLVGQATGLDPCTLYEATVWAVDGVGNVSAAAPARSARTVAEGAPAAPATLVAVAHDGYVALEWTPSTTCDVNGYTVYRRVLPDGTAAALVGGLALTAHVDQTVTNGTTYAYTVRANDREGLESGDSPVAEAAPVDEPPPPPPANLTATALSARRVELFWETVGEAQRYEVFRAEGAIDPDALPASPLAVAYTAWFLDTPPHDGVWAYTVRWIPALGEPSAAATPALATADGTVPTCRVDAAPGAIVSEGIVTLTVTPSEPLAAGSAPVLTIKAPGGTPTPVALTADAGGASWSGAVPFTGSDPEGAWALSWSGTDALGNRGAGAPQAGITHVVVDHTPPVLRATLTPAPPLPNGDVLVTVTTDEPLAAPPSLDVTLPGGTATPVLLAGADEAFEGAFAIPAGTPSGVGLLDARATDLAGNEATVLTEGGSFAVDTDAPAPPSGLTVEAIAGGRLQMIWTAPPEAATGGLTYRVVRDAAPGGDPAAQTPLDEGSALTFFSDLPPADGDWAYAVQSIDAAGNASPFTAWVVGTSDQTPPGAPVGVVATVEADTVVVRWEAPAGEAPLFYRVSRASGAGAPVVVRSRVEALETVDVPAGDGEYTYTVEAVDAVGNVSVPSDGAPVTFDGAPPVVTVTGVEDGGVYGDPVSIAVEASDASDVTLDVTLDGVAFAVPGAVADPGAHALLVVATDGGGRETRRSVDFLLDLEPPVITVGGVAAGATYFEPVVITVSVSDDTDVTTTIRLDGAAFPSGTPVAAEGSHELVVQATDEAGNGATRTVPFTIDLPPGAPGQMVAVVDLDAGDVTVSFGGLPADAAEVRLFRDGALVATGAGEPLDAGAAPTELVRVILEAEVVDAADQVGPRSTVVIYPVRYALASYGRVDAVAGDHLARWMLDEARLTVTNTDLQDLMVGPLGLSLEDDEGTAWFQQDGRATRVLGRQSEIAWNAPVHSHRELTDTGTLRVALGVGQTAPGARLVLKRSFPVNVGWPAAEVTNFSATGLWLGAQGLVALGVTNHGTAPLGLKMGDVRVRLTDPLGGDVYATANVTAVGLPTVVTGEGTFVVVPPGATTTFPPVALTVPGVAGDVVRIEGVIDRYWGAVGTADVFSAPGHGGSTSHNVTAPPYAADIEAAEDAVLLGETIHLTGRAYDTATGADLAGASVRLRIRKGGFEQTRYLTSGADGSFALAYVPPPGMAGRYEFAADHPAVVSFATDDAVQVHGLVASYGTVAVRLARGATFVASVPFRNVGDQPLTGLSVAIAGGAAGDGVTVALDAPAPSTLAAGATVTLRVRVDAADDAVADAWRDVTVTTAEGASAETRLTVRTTAPEPVPVLEPTGLRVGLDAGEVQVRQVLVRNAGTATWRGVQVVPPAPDTFVRVGTDPALGDLAPGDARVVDVVVAPPSGTPTGITNGTVVEFVGTDGVTANLPVAVAVTTDLVGSVHVAVRDATRQLTDPDAPIAGAEVKVVSTATPGLVHYTGTTDATGAVTFTDVPAGTYSYRVTATGFTPVDTTGSQVLEVVPGQSTLVDVALITSPVDVSFTVTPTTITDSYEITIETTFQTDVPAPAVAIIPAYQSFVLSAGETTTGELTLFNNGLVSAWNVRLAQTPSTYVQIAYGVESIPELPAQGAVTIPYTVHLKSHGSPPPPVCEPQCTTTRVESSWYCASADIWVPMVVTQTVCVDVPICRVNVNQSTIVRTNWIGDCGPSDPPNPPLCVTNATGGPVRLCDCGVVSARGIGLPNLSSLLDSFVDLGEDKAADLIDQLTQGDIPEGERGLVGSTIDSVRSGVQYLEAGKALVDAAIAGDCDEPGLAGRITATLAAAEDLLRDAIVEEILSRYTGGIIGYEATETTFDKDCIAQGETACAETGDAAHSFGAGTFSFCVRCGSCGAPEEAGPECPVSVPYVDVTVYCGGGTVSQTVSGRGGGGDPWWWGWGGGDGGTAPAPCAP